MRTTICYLMLFCILLCGTSSCRHRSGKSESVQSIPTQSPNIEIVVEEEKEAESIDKYSEEIIQKIKAFYADYGKYGEAVDTFIGTTSDFEEDDECDIFTQSQDPDDHYTVSVDKSTSVENGFDVKWKERYDGSPVHLIWVFASEDGQWKLDKIICKELGRMMIP